MSSSQVRIQLGWEVKDIVTGFCGIVTARVEYINGCVQLCVTPGVGQDGKMPDGVYLDHQRLRVVGAGITADDAYRASDTGGVMRDAPSATYRG